MGNKVFFKGGKLRDDSTVSGQKLLDSKPAYNQICGAWLLAITLTSSFLFTIIAWRTNIFLKSVSSQLVIRPGSRISDFWSEDPVTTTFSVYLFNYTNTGRFEDLLDDKLQVEELGPFSYVVTSVKENITYNSNGTVSYQDRKVYTFSPELSVGSLTDLVVTPSIPYMSVLNHFRESNLITRWAIGKAISLQLESTMFVTVSVEELLWGYEDRLFSIASRVHNVQQEEKLPFERFGLFAGKNGTQPDISTIFTGELDITKKGMISRFNGQVGLDHWATPQCNSLEAYSSSALPPYLSAETIYLYSKDACRRIPMTYQYTTMVQGVPTFRYELPVNVYDHGIENECFCGQTCLPDGVLNISACAFGGPLVASKPHFLHGSPALRERYLGFEPDEEKHRMYVNIEPNLGMILNARTTAQLNVMVRNVPGMSLNPVYQDTLILPVTWVSLTMDQLPASLVWEARGYVAAFYISQAVFYYGPLVLSIVCISILIRRQCRQHGKQTSLMDSSIITDSRVC